MHKKTRDGKINPVNDQYFFYAYFNMKRQSITQTSRFSQVYSASKGITG
jgi:hypothetical protein